MTNNGGHKGEITRLCEWSKVRVSPQVWTRERRMALTSAADSWRRVNNLPQAPLNWSGVDGCVLEANRYAGVVQIEGATVEIYPKLDAHLLERTAPDESAAHSVLSSLTWMLEVANFGDAIDAQTATLGTAPLEFADIWAWLFARDLREQLQLGLASAYIAHQDDIMAVRGRIQIARQVSQNWNRFDRIACAWDEWTPDTALNRVLKCACRVLSRRVSHPVTRGLIFDCLFLLEEVRDVAPETALHAAARLIHTRATERFRLSFDFARRILQGSGPALGAGGEDTFVFLVNMDKVFEAFARAVIEARFNTIVTEQKDLGTLLELRLGGVRQKADLHWRDNDGVSWIADAKYKHLAKDSQNALDFFDDETENRAGRKLSPDDVRQVGVYAELLRRQNKGIALPQLMILYPFVGKGRFAISQCRMWNGAQLSLVPLCVTPRANLRQCAPL